MSASNFSNFYLGKVGELICLTRPQLNAPPMGTTLIYAWEHFIIFATIENIDDFHRILGVSMISVWHY